MKTKLAILFHLPRLTLVGACMALALSATSGPAHAGAADQARRQTHFEWLKAHDVFRSTGIVDGVPQLVLGPAANPEQTDAVSLAAFCKLVFEYYAELDSRHTQMIVIDGTTGRRVAVVDATGYHNT